MEEMAEVEMNLEKHKMKAGKRKESQAGNVPEGRKRNQDSIKDFGLKSIEEGNNLGTSRREHGTS